MSNLADAQKQKTIDGKELFVHVKNGAVTINDVGLLATGMQAVVHSLDKVVLHVN